MQDFVHQPSLVEPRLYEFKETPALSMRQFRPARFGKSYHERFGFRGSLSEELSGVEEK